MSIANAVVVTLHKSVAAAWPCFDPAARSEISASTGMFECDMVRLLTRIIRFSFYWLQIPCIDAKTAFVWSRYLEGHSND